MSHPGIRPVVRRAVLATLGERGYEHVRARSVARDIRRGLWTEPEIPILACAVAPGDFVVDAGANYGLYSFHLAAAVGPRGVVHAFEPVPGTCTTLHRVTRLLSLGNVRVVEAGVSDEGGSARMVVPRRDDGSADTGKAWTVRAGAGTAGGAVEVRMVRLDDELPRVEVTFLKCDVEGAELFALRGAADLLRRHAPTLLLETSRPAMSRYGVEPEQVQTLLEDLGYATYRYDSDARALRPSLAGDMDGNLLAVHPRRAARLAKLGAAEPLGPS
jgi:FkbM family methyltransferase